MNELYDNAIIYRSIVDDAEVDIVHKRYYASIIDCMLDNIKPKQHEQQYFKATSHVTMTRAEFENELKRNRNVFIGVTFTENIRGFNGYTTTAIIFKDCNFHDLTDAFWFQTNLEHLTFQNCTTTKNDLSYVCAYCTNLQSLTFDIDLLNVDNMSHAFEGCCNLQDLDIHNSFINIKNATCMFAGCRYLKTAVIQDTENIKYADMMFRSCSKLETVEMTLNASSRTDIFWKSRGCII